MSEPKGCLLFLIEIFKKQQKNEALPYEGKKLLSEAELSFYNVLKESTKDTYEIMCKVKLDDIIQVKKGTENWQSQRNKINRKHIDFVLCSSKNMQTLCAIELDDKSHEREDRQERDEFVDRVLRAAEIKILHVKCQKSYNTNEIAEMITNTLKTTRDSSTDSEPTT